jgi:hypothetical protein
MALRFGLQTGGFISGLIFAAQTSFTGTEVAASGVLVAQSAAAAGVAEREVIDLGSDPQLSAQSASVAGTGSIVLTFTSAGAVIAGDASAAGVGEMDENAEITGFDPPPPFEVGQTGVLLQGVGFGA